MLYGIPAFYPKFGFAPAFPHVTYTMAVRDAQRVPHGRLRFVKFTDGHLRAVLRMYERNNSGRTGPTRREAKVWAPFRRGRNWGPRIAVRVGLDGRGRAVAYLAHDVQLDATIVEVGYARPQAFGDLVRLAAGVAWASRAEKITFLLPEDEPLMRFCAPYGLNKELRYRPDGGCMVRMINIPAAMRKIAPLLATRAGGSGRLTIRTNLDDVGLSWSPGRLEVGRPRRQGPTVRLPQWALAQLLYGYRDTDSLVQHGNLAGTKEGISALSMLFPPGPHYHYLVDHF
jgi:predicted acetyltransferase